MAEVFPQIIFNVCVYAENVKIKYNVNRRLTLAIAIYWGIWRLGKSVATASTSAGCG